jgi:peptidyl-prolyl cis-trans isomerase-like protein 2
MTEWTTDFGGKRAALGQGNTMFLPLAFNCCALSFQPFEDPVCTSDGIIFDVTNILPWLKKYKIDPITGKPMTSKDLFPLKFHKNAEGKFHCPITFKEFTDFTHIVAIRPSGNVYSYDAVEELNLRPKNFRDLIDDTPFKKEDIITIQDPNNLERRNLNNFHFLQTGMTMEEDDGDKLKNIQLPEKSKKMLRSLNEKHETMQKDKEEKMRIEAENAPEYNPGQQMTRVDAQAPGFTASNFTSATVAVDAREVVQQVDKKGYVRLHTSLGDLNLELHCDIVSKTCENFLGLCEKGYYNDTTFHRLVPGFMIQGGDPTGTGRGGESLWGKPFKDEFSNKLQHTGRGIVSMANSGKDTNGSQFFITFSAQPSLNLKHSVFGRVVGGSEVLSKMEAIPTDKNEKPLKSIVLEKVSVYVNPYKETKADRELKAKQEAEAKAQQLEDSKRGQWYSNPAQVPLPKVQKTGIGKYIQPEGTKKKEPEKEVKEIGIKRPLQFASSKPAKKGGYGDFSNF